MFDLKIVLKCVHIIRCGSFTLALAVVIVWAKRPANIRENLSKRLEIICTLRKFNMSKELDRKNLPMPMSDIDIRSGSTFEMIKQLIEISGFSRKFEELRLLQMNKTKRNDRNVSFSEAFDNSATIEPANSKEDAVALEFCFSFIEVL